MSNPLALLYPHLNFNRVPVTPTPNNTPRSVDQKPPVPPPKPAIRSQSVERPSENSENRAKTPDKVERKVVIQEPKHQRPPDDITQDSASESSSSSSESSDSSDSSVVPVPRPKPAPKPRAKRAKPEVDPKIEPVRESQLPVKGEKGLQRKYNFEQRKQMYMNRLSRKSVKLAEKEVGEVYKVLDSVKHDPDGLKVEEQRLKRGLKLVNYAKFFATKPSEEKSDAI